MTTKPLSLSIFIFIILFSLGAQNLSVLNEPIYQDLNQWQQQGYIPRLPSLQPWPQQIIIESLQLLIQSDQVPADVKARAQTHLNRLEQPEPSIQLMTMATHRRNLADTSAHRTLLAPGLDISWNLHPLVHLSVSGNPQFVEPRISPPILPTFQRETYDWIPDWSDIELAGRSIGVYTRLLSHMTLGTPEFQFFTGFGRTSFGPFFEDGIVLSSQAPFGVYYGYTWHQPRLSFSFLYRPLTATTMQGGDRAPDKHLVFKSLEYQAFPWLRLYYFESLVWGQRFDLTYFVPFSTLFHSQGIGGFEGNSILGVGALLEPIPGLHIPFQIYVDDAHFNDMASLQFDTMYKLAIQTGIQWYPIPQHPLVRNLELDYTLVTPYMYTHWDEVKTPTNSSDVTAWRKRFNFSNYTHLGQNLATGLPPNSDRIQFQWQARPLNWLHTRFDTRYIRHGNASQGTPIIPQIGTGSLFDSGHHGDLITFRQRYGDLPITRFLVQDVLLRVLQLGIQTTFSLDAITPFSRLDLSLGYVFEQVWNQNLESGNNTTNHFVSFDFQLRY